jgi:hypothetical protein
MIREIGTYPLRCETRGLREGGSESMGERFLKRRIMVYMIL